MTELEEQARAYDLTIDALQKRIEELEVQVPKWHKVSDGDLPNSVVDRVICIDHWHRRFILVLHKDDNMTYWEDDDGDFFYRLDSVKWWCEFPQPPKEG